MGKPHGCGRSVHLTHTHTHTHILITYEYTSFPPLRRLPTRHAIPRCLLGQQSHLSMYVGTTVAISHFSQSSTYAGGVAVNVDVCGANTCDFSQTSTYAGGGVGGGAGGAP